MDFNDETDLSVDEPFGAPEYDEEYGACEQAADTADLADGLEELEIDGETYLVPTKLRNGFLMQADYTRKTQDLADHRRAFEAERQSFEAQRTQSDDRRRLAEIEGLVGQFEQLDWKAASQENPGAAKAALALFEQAVQMREALADKVSVYEEAEAARALSAHRAAVEQGLTTLSRDIPDWSAPLAGEMAAFAQSEFGFTPDEVGEVVDPRLVKLLHRAYKGATSEARVNRIRATQNTSPATTLRGGHGRFHAASNTDDFAAFERLADAKLKTR